MKVYEIIFSPTGGTKKAADAVASALGAPETIDLSAADFSGCTLEKDSAAVIAMPSFGGRAPETAIKRLKLIKGNGAKAAVIAVYGNRAQEDTLIEMADAAKECGFSVIAGITAVAEHSIARQYAAGRPDDKDKAQLKNFGEKIKEKLSSSSCAEPEIKGNRPYKKGGSGLVPQASSACVKCGICADKCPVSAIDRNSPDKTDKKLCITCMRCAAVCPNNARKASGFMVKAVAAVLKKPCSEPKENELFI